MLSARSYTHCYRSYHVKICLCVCDLRTHNRKNNDRNKNRTTTKKKSSHITQTPACSSVSADGCFICWLPCVVFNHQLWWLAISCHFLLAWNLFALGHFILSFCEHLAVLSISCHLRQAARFVWVWVRLTNDNGSGSGSYSGAFLACSRYGGTIWWWCFLLLFAGFLSHWFTSVSRQATLWAPHNCFYYSIITY